MKQWKITLIMFHTDYIDVSGVSEQEDRSLKGKRKDLGFTSAAQSRPWAEPELFNGPARPGFARNTIIYLSWVKKKTSCSLSSSLDDLLRLFVARRRASL